MSRCIDPTSLTALVANEKGEIFDLEGYAALGSDGPVQTRLTTANTVALPHGSELMYLPQRLPTLFNLKDQCIQTLSENPYTPGEPIFPVAAFNSPGYVITHICAYAEAADAAYLPLFSYGAVGWHGDRFRSAVIQVDHEPRQDLRRMPLAKVKAGTHDLAHRLPGNRLRAHFGKLRIVIRLPGG